MKSVSLLLAAMAGIALAHALRNPSAPSWGFTLANLLLLGLTLRASKLRRIPQAGDYFEKWPAAFDTLIADGPIPARIAAAQWIGTEARVPLWTYRDDAIRILKYIAVKRDIDAEVQMAAIQALQQLEPTDATGLY